MKFQSILDGFANFGAEDVVNLSDCSLDDKTIAPLLRHGSFRFKSLLLDQNRLTDVTAASLATVLCASPTLSTLSLRATQIGDRGAQALSRWVETTKASTLSLDLRETQVVDDGVHRLCVAARRTQRPCLRSLQLERTGMQGLGGIIDFLQSPASTKLEALRCIAVDLDTLHEDRDEVTPEDFDTADYTKPKDGEEEEEEQPNDELRSRLQDEAESVGEVETEALLPPTPEFLRIVERLVAAIESRPALVDVDVGGIPQRYIDEIRWIIADRAGKASSSPKKSVAIPEKSLSWERSLARDLIKELTDGRAAGDTRISPNVSIRSYIGRTLYASLGDALFECQWHKAMGNQAVADGKGEMAFIARFLRRVLKDFQVKEDMKKNFDDEAPPHPETTADAEPDKVDEEVRETSTPGTPAETPPPTSETTPPPETPPETPPPDTS